MSFLYLLEGLRTPVLDCFFGAVTHLGAEILFMAAAVGIYWCYSKKWGCYLLSVGFLGILLNQTLKILCRIPRPWVLDPDFSIVESARAGASGYSFPSGHAANVSATLGCCARLTKRRGLRALCLSVIVLVCFSRMYLGVHTPKDVLTSLCISAVLVLAAYPLFARLEEDSVLLRRIILCLTGISVLYALWLGLRVWPADVDAENLASAEKSGRLFLGSGAGMTLGLWADHKYLHFDVRAPGWAQVLKVALGLGLLVAVKGLLKLAFAAAGFGPSADAVRYCLMVEFATCVWPLTFPWFARGCRRAGGSK